MQLSPETDTFGFNEENLDINSSQYQNNPKDKATSKQPLEEEFKNSVSTYETENEDTQREISEFNKINENSDTMSSQDQSSSEEGNVSQIPLKEFNSNVIAKTANEDIQRAINAAITETNKDLLNNPNAIEQIRKRATRKMTSKDKIKQSQKQFNKKSWDWSFVGRTAEAAKKGATTLAAASVGRAVLHASFSTVYDTCDVALSKNKKRALSKVLPGVAVSLIPGVGLLAGIGLSMASGYLGGKAYDKVLSSRTVEIHHELFLPNTLLSNVDDSINQLKAKVMSMGTPYYECRPAIVDLTTRTEEYLENYIKKKFDEIEAKIDSMVIENMTVDATANKIKDLTKSTEAWYNSLCDNLQQLEQYIETLLMEEPENLIQIQDDISKAYDDLVEVITKDVPEALKEGMKQMQALLKMVQA